MLVREEDQLSMADRFETKKNSQEVQSPKRKKISSQGGIWDNSASNGNLGLSSQKPLPYQSLSEIDNYEILIGGNQRCKIDCSISCRRISFNIYRCLE